MTKFPLTVRYFILFGILAFLPTASVRAEDSTALQDQLSSLLAAEDECGMSYDQDAIQRFIEKHVADDDLDFAASLPVMTKGQQYQVQQMSESGKLAFCTQQRRVAKKLGFAQ